MYATKRADAGHAVSSIRVALAAIKTAHLYAGVGLDMRDSRLAMVMDGIARSKGTRPKRQAAAAVPETMRKLLASLPIQTSSEEENPTITAQSASQAIKIRNRAMMLLGFGGALRRSEIVALNIGDVEIIEDKGLAVLIRQSKGDQQGAGQTVAIWANEKEREFCPMAALIAWLKIRQDEQRLKSYDNGGLERPLFCAVLRDGTLSGHAMADKVIPRIIKQAAEETGFNPEKFSGHSLRRGLLTAAGNLRLPLRDVMKHSRHKSVETAMGYMESGEMWRNNITEDIFHAD
jgi:integrase